MFFVEGVFWVFLKIKCLIEKLKKKNNIGLIINSDGGFNILYK